MGSLSFLSCLCLRCVTGGVKHIRHSCVAQGPLMPTCGLIQSYQHKIMAHWHQIVRLMNITMQMFQLVFSTVPDGFMLIRGNKMGVEFRVIAAEAAAAAMQRTALAN
uniref:Secreted protein n=3 Tax=Oryza TaxID=4527 RepID=A0A0D3GMV6_9ORYZ